ncbi:Unknown protein, partial [Striga hermonthica]
REEDDDRQSYASYASRATHDERRARRDDREHYNEGRRRDERRDEGHARYHDRDDPRDERASMRPTIVMPTFTGTDPDAWLSRAVQFLKINDVPRYERVQIAAYHLDGEANVWWQWVVHKNHGEHMRWRDFEKELITRFGSSDYHDYNEALSRIKQVGSLKDYQKEFERIASRVRDWPEAALVGTFVGGLKAGLAAEVRLDRSRSMRAAIESARLHEDHLVAVRKTKPSDVRTETKRTNAATEELTGRTESKPMGETVRTTSNIRRLTDEEMQRRREKGLCYSCNEKFMPGHRCKGKEVFLLEIGDNCEEEEPRDESLFYMVKSKKCVPKMITFTAEVRGKLVEVLVDSGSTLNFIDEELSKEIEIPFTKVKPFGVKVPNGETLRGDILFKSVKLKAQGQRMRVDLYALPLKATDIVLGCQWLETLGPITTDYWKGTMEFGRSSKRVKLRTEDPGESPDEDDGDVGEVAYRLALPPELSGIHNVFHASMLRKYVCDPDHVIPHLDIQVQSDLSYEERPVAVLDRQVRRVRKRDVPLVRIQWDRHGATWEAESDIRT